MTNLQSCILTAKMSLGGVSIDGQKNPHSRAPLKLPIYEYNVIFKLSYNCFSYFKAVGKGAMYHYFLHSYQQKYTGKVVRHK